MFESVGLVAHFDKKESIRLVEDLAQYLTKKGLEVYIENTLTDEMDIKQEGVPLTEMNPDF